MVAGGARSMSYAPAPLLEEPPFSMVFLSQVSRNSRQSRGRSMVGQWHMWTNMAGRLALRATHGSHRQSWSRGSRVTPGPDSRGIALTVSTPDLRRGAPATACVHLSWLSETTDSCGMESNRSNVCDLFRR